MQDPAATGIVLWLVVVPVVVLVLVALFFLGRSVTLWYFKIDERVELLKEIRDSLRSPSGAQSPPRRLPGETDEEYADRVATEPPA